MALARTTRGSEDSRVRLERDLYHDILQLGRQRRVQPFLSGALQKIVQLTGAERGYLELGSEQPSGEMRHWYASHGCEIADVEAIRRRVSRGIVAEAMSSGETVLSQSALLDERFSDRESVRAGGVEAVLCTAVGRDEPLGVIYLEGRTGFDEEDKAVVELFSEHLAPLAEGVLLREMRSGDVDVPEDVRRFVGSSGFVCASPSMFEVLRMAASVATFEVPILLTGESGTGKTQLARMIHEAGPRRGAPFVEVNCATLLDTLIENELFGAVAGAHSTANRPIEGKIAAASGGTLFLDEVSELSLAAQPKLLQFLNSREYYPLGSTVPRRSEARIIAATNVDLRQAVEQRRFREDLLWRLQVLPIRLPSLAERREDIEALVEHFCASIPLRHGLPRLPLSPAAFRAILSAEWPGNIRQLEHALQAAMIRAATQHARTIDVGHVFPGSTESSAPETKTWQEATREFQAELLRSTLVSCDWNISESARRLDLARSHLYELLHAFGIARDHE